ncbi:MAG: gliding motility-associated C-terminal domain-containing protein [Crocinitomicaceae bacterium]|nr:gliding motility-associated C-terminal domain-containing protein [Crocinitomicaceae bacterium]
MRKNRITFLLSKILLVVVLCAYCSVSSAQLDTKHYIPPMFGKEDLGTHYLVLGTPVTSTFNVTVKDGAGNIITTIPISSGSSSTTQIGTELNSPFLVSESQLNTPVANKGLILTAPEPFYASVRVKVAAQAGSLTSKGEKAAVGTEFRTGHMFNNTGYINGKSNVISFMATENNTTVTISDISPGVMFRSTNFYGSPLTTNDITVTLNAGESYVLAAYFDENNTTNNNVNGVNGTLITSDKGIVVNCGTWLGGNARSGTQPTDPVAEGRDIGIDQIVPKENIGDEYVLIKGFGVENERTFVVASEDNTQIYLGGASAPVATLNAGDFHVIEGTSFSGNNNLYLTASSPVFVTQTLNGADGYTDDNERQAGIIFLPPVKCTGAKEVTIPNAAFIGTAYISIIADVGASVTVNGNPISGGLSVPGTPDYVTYQVSGYSGDVKISSDKLVRVALLNLDGNIGAAGYFSGFSKDINLTASYQNNTQVTNDEISEGCGLATITIERSSLEANSTQTVNLNVLGTATEGVDYTTIPNQLTFAVGQTIITLPVEAFSDNLTEGDESVILELTLDGQVCGSDELAFIIKDVQDINVVLDDSNVQCPGDDVALTAIVTGGVQPYEYIWSNGSSSEFITVTPDSTSTYSVTVTDICQMDSSSTSAVVNVPTYNLIIQSSNDTSVLCPYTEMIIASEATGGLPDYNYQWFEDGQYILNGPVLSISPAESTDYIVVITDQCGLETQDTVSIQVQTPLMELTVPEDIVACPYDTSTVWVDVSGGLAPYEYYWSHSGETTAGVAVNPGWTTTYTVTVTDACNSYALNAHPKVEVIKPNADFEVLSTTQMENLPVYFDNTTSGGNSWFWNFGNGESSTEFAPGTTFEENGIYVVTLIATNSLGCKDTATKEIRIKPEYYFFAPNAFTPNGDSFNNYCSVSVIGALGFEFTLYNRWGEQILYTTDQYFQWDGSYQGLPVDDGVYTYRCTVRNDAGEIFEYVGHVAVLK